MSPQTEIFCVVSDGKIIHSPSTIVDQVESEESIFGARLLKHQH
jgi:hypothetical protein